MVMLTWVAITAVWVTPAEVQGQSGASEAASEDLRGVYYGDGLRHYAEGDYEQAVEALFRAYGLEPSPDVMALIIDAYDEMGDCRAARRQMSFAEERYPESDVELQACQSTGLLVAECNGVDESVTINGGIEAQCGTAVEVPADREHRVLWGTGAVQWSSVDAEQRRTLEPPQSTSDDVDDVAGVERLPGVEGQVPRLPFKLDESPDVPRLTLPSDFFQSHYRIIQAPDGIYRIWSPATDSTEVESDADVDIICPDDDADSAEGCPE